MRFLCKIGFHVWKCHEDYGYGFTEKCIHCGLITDRGDHWN